MIVREPPILSSECMLIGRQEVCQPMTPEWRHTVERFKAAFPRWAA